MTILTAIDRRVFLGRVLGLGGAAVLTRGLAACADETRNTRDTTAADTALADTTRDDTSVADIDAAPDAAETATVCEATTRDAEGPFYEPDAPAVTDLAGGLAGEPIALEGEVRDARCLPIAGATVEVWQADDDGDYHDDRLRATLTTGADGAWAFDSIKPGRYLQATGLRPAHIHFRVSAPGFTTLVTQLYFEGDPYLQPEDSCTTCGSDDPARIIPLSPADGKLRGVFVIALARET